MSAEAPQPQNLHNGHSTTSSSWLDPNQPDSCNIQYAACQLFVAWQYRYLGHKHRIVIPDWHVWRIGDGYPHPNHQYVGFWWILLVDGFPGVSIQMSLYYWDFFFVLKLFMSNFYTVSDIFDGVSILVISSFIFFQNTSTAKITAYICYNTLDCMTKH